MKMVIVSQEHILLGPDGPRGLGYLSAHNLLSSEIVGQKVLLARGFSVADGSEMYNQAKVLIDEANADSVRFVPLTGVKGLRSALSVARETYQTMLATIEVGDVVVLRNLGWMQWLGFLAARRKQARVLVQMLGAYDKQEQMPRSLPFRLLNRGMFHLEKQMMCRADQLALVSPWLLGAYELGEQEQVKMAKLATLLPDTSLTRDWFSAVVTAHRLPLRLLFVGRLESVKAVDVLLETVRLLVVARAEREGGHIPVVLDIVGDGSMRAELTQYVSDHALDEVVTFHGFLSGDALRVQYDRAHVFVLPSHSEGLPIVLLEAMARSKAVIASDIAAHRFVIREQEEGLLFQVGEAKSLAEAVTSLVCQPMLYETLAANAYAKAAEYSLEVVWKRWNELVAEL